MGWAPGRGRILGAGPMTSWLKEEEEDLLLQLRCALTTWDPCPVGILQGFFMDAQARGTRILNPGSRCAPQCTGCQE